MKHLAGPVTGDSEIDRRRIPQSIIRRTLAADSETHAAIVGPSRVAQCRVKTNLPLRSRRLGEIRPAGDHGVDLQFIWNMLTQNRPVLRPASLGDGNKRRRRGSFDQPRMRRHMLHITPAMRERLRLQIAIRETFIRHRRHIHPSRPDPELVDRSAITAAARQPNPVEAQIELSAGENVSVLFRWRPPRRIRIDEQTRRMPALRVEVETDRDEIFSPDRNLVIQSPHPFLPGNPKPLASAGFPEKQFLGRVAKKRNPPERRVRSAFARRQIVRISFGDKAEPKAGAGRAQVAIRVQIRRMKIVRIDIAKRASAPGLLGIFRRREQHLVPRRHQIPMSLPRRDHLRRRPIHPPALRRRSPRLGPADSAIPSNQIARLIIETVIRQQMPKLRRLRFFANRQSQLVELERQRVGRGRIQAHVKRVIDRSIEARRLRRTRDPVEPFSVDIKRHPVAPHAQLQRIQLQIPLRKMPDHNPLLVPLIANVSHLPNTNGRIGPQSDRPEIIGPSKSDARPASPEQEARTAIHYLGRNPDVFQNQRVILDRIHIGDQIHVAQTASVQQERLVLFLSSVERVVSGAVVPCGVVVRRRIQVQLISDRAVVEILMHQNRPRRQRTRIPKNSHAKMRQPNPSQAGATHQLGNFPRRDLVSGNLVTTPFHVNQMRPRSAQLHSQHRDQTVDQLRHDTGIQVVRTQRSRPQTGKINDVVRLVESQTVLLMVSIRQQILQDRMRLRGNLGRVQIPVASDSVGRKQLIRPPRRDSGRVRVSFAAMRLPEINDVFPGLQIRRIQTGNPVRKIQFPRLLIDIDKLRRESGERIRIRIRYEQPCFISISFRPPHASIRIRIALVRPVDVFGGHRHIDGGSHHPASVEHDIRSRTVAIRAHDLSAVHGPI